MEYYNTNKFKVVLISVFLNGLNLAYGSCYRKPQGATGDSSPVDDSYHIYIDGNPSDYIPGQEYNISISCAHGLNFISFTLLVEADVNASALNSASAGSSEAAVGRFKIIDKAETRFSSLCENMIESSNTNIKHRIVVSWIAPSSPESGCVLFKAGILQHRNVWFIDDGFLTKRLCREETDSTNGDTPPMNPCCACDEAKYEIILERKWGRNTHAKDFPPEAWRTRLGEVIGASHTAEYHFWQHGVLASKGLRELAEHGATKTLEQEIKQQARTGSIRTIIKAPGIKYRANVIGKTLATVRVGTNHHVISLVSKIDPSPDWILGVSGLELCLRNCTWIEYKVVNLYPWDIGTDSGPTYTSPDQAQHPPDVVRQISSSFPSDIRSPFFDKSGALMKPLATLHVTRKRTYERQCDFEETGALECSTHPWSNWTECSAKCGPGSQYTYRSYKDPQVAKNFNCSAHLKKSQTCIGTQCSLPQAVLPSAECELTNWSWWSECSNKCGKGLQTRTRDYRNPYAREKCQAGVAVDLQQTRSCSGENCGGNIPSFYDGNNNDMFDKGVGETGFDRNSFDNDQQHTNWRATDSQEREEKYDGLNNNMNPYIENPDPDGNDENERTEDAKNIYGNDKLIGGRFRNTYNPQNPIESNGFDQQRHDFCLEKPAAPTRPCNKKRPIVKNYWFYDADDGECKLFTADNCDENRNKFLSMEKCLDTCSEGIIQDNQETNSFHRRRYKNRGFDVTAEPPFRSRWH